MQLWVSKVASKFKLWAKLLLIGTYNSKPKQFGAFYIELMMIDNKRSNISNKQKIFSAVLCTYTKIELI